MNCEKCEKFDKVIRGLLAAQVALFEKLYDEKGLDVFNQCGPELSAMSVWTNEIEELIGRAHCPKCWEPDSLIREVHKEREIFICQACGYSEDFELEVEEDPYAEYREDYEGRESEWW